MNQIRNCIFQLNSDNFWQCQNPKCMWICPKILKNPPQRNCLPKKYISAQTRKKGPGTELRKLIKRLRIKERLGCKCKQHAQLMDQRGCDWCEKNLELIVDWLEEEAEKRGLLFLRTAGKMIVRRAIKKARQLEEQEIQAT